MINTEWQVHNTSELTFVFNKREPLTESEAEYERELCKAFHAETTVSFKGIDGSWILTSRNTITHFDKGYSEIVYTGAKCG